MFDQASRCRPKLSAPRRRQPLRPVLEELEPRLTPAEVGLNDFRISHMGPDGNPTYGAFDPAVAYNGAANEYLVVWDGDDNTGLLVNDEFEIFGHRLSAATGAPIGANDFRISDMGLDGNTTYGAFTPAV